MKLDSAISQGKIDIKLKSNLLKIESEKVTLNTEEETEPLVLQNDLVYIFAGGELPTQFLQKSGVEITKRFGYTVKKHK